MSAAFYPQVQKIYVAYYGRPADPAGLQYWAGQLAANGGNLTSIINAFGASAESTALYAGADNSAKVTAIYQQLFNRAPDAAGLAFYTAELTANRMTASSIALNVANGAQGTDATYLNNKVTVATSFTDSLTVDSAAAVAYTGTTATTAARSLITGVTTSAATTNVASTITSIKAGGGAAAGQTFTLTTGTNRFTGTSGDDTFDAGLSTGSLQTLNSGDSLDGGAGNDELVAVLNGSVTPLAIKSIESITFSNIAANSVFDASNVSGVTSLTSAGSSAATFIQGIGKDLAPNIQDTTSAHTVTYKDVTGTADSATVNIRNVTGAPVFTAAGVETLNLNSAGAVTNVLGAPVLDATTKLVVGGSVGLTLGSLVAGAPLVTSIDASGLKTTNGIGLTTTIAATSASTITGSNGNDTITLTTSSAADSVSAGAGNDSIVFTAGYSTTDSVDGGDGTDSLTTTFALMASQSAATPTTYRVTNIETLVTNTDTMTTNTYTPANISQSANALTFAGTGAAALSAGGQTHTVAGPAGSFSLNLGQSVAGNVGVFGTDTFTISAAGTATTDSLTITNRAVNSTTGAQLAVFGTSAIGVTGYETVTINNGAVGGVAQAVGTVTLTGSNAANTKLVLTGANNFTAGVISANVIDASGLTAPGTASTTGNATLFMVTGSTATTITGSGGFDTLFGHTTSASSIDGGAGNDSITGGSGNDTILGGAGADTITAAAGNDSVDGGDGNDRVDIATALDLTEDDKIAGGAGTDILAYTSAATDTAAANSGVSGFEILLVDSVAANTITMSNFINNPTFTEVRFGSTSAAGRTHTTNNAPASITTLAFVAGANGGNNNTVVFDRLLDTSSNSLTILDRNTAAHTITALTINDEETVNISGLTAAADLTVSTLNAQDLTTLNVTGDADVVFTLANAVSSTLLQTVNASTSTGAVTLNASNSGYSITATAGTGVFTFTGGGAADSITGGASADILVGGTGNDTINGGAGSDNLTGGNGQDTINVGAGTADVVIITATGQTFSGAVTTGVTVLNGASTGADLVYGLAAGDQIDLQALTAGAYTAAATAILTALLTGGTNGDIAMTRGTYSTTSGIWITNALGADTLLQYDTDGTGAGTTVESIVLVGYATTGTTTTTADGLITLA